MVYRYDYEIIDGRECLTGGHAWNEQYKPAPEEFKGTTPLPLELKDENGKYIYIKGEEGEPVLAPVKQLQEELDFKEMEEKKIKIIDELAKTMVENDVTVGALLGKGRRNE